MIWIFIVVAALLICAAFAGSIFDSYARFRESRRSDPKWIFVALAVVVGVPLIFVILEHFRQS